MMINNSTRTRMYNTSFSSPWIREPFAYLLHSRKASTIGLYGSEKYISIKSTIFPRLYTNKFDFYPVSDKFEFATQKAAIITINA